MGEVVVGRGCEDRRGFIYQLLIRCIAKEFLWMEFGRLETHER